jgi:hypothetical protein
MIKIRTGSVLELARKVRGQQGNQVVPLREEAEVVRRSEEIEDQRDMRKTARPQAAKIERNNI